MRPTAKCAPSLLAAALLAALLQTCRGASQSKSCTCVREGCACAEDRNPGGEEATASRGPSGSSAFNSAATGSTGQLSVSQSKSGEGPAAMPGLQISSVATPSTGPAASSTDVQSQADKGPVAKPITTTSSIAASGTGPSTGKSKSGKGPVMPGMMMMMPDMMMMPSMMMMPGMMVASGMAAMMPGMMMEERAAPMPGGWRRWPGMPGFDPFHFVFGGRRGPMFGGFPMSGVFGFAGRRR